MKLALQACSLLILVIYLGSAQAQAPVADLEYVPPISRDERAVCRQVPANGRNDADGVGT